VCHVGACACWLVLGVAVGGFRAGFLTSFLCSFGASKEIPNFGSLTVPALFLRSFGAPKEAQNYCSLTIPALERKCFREKLYSPWSHFSPRKHFPQE
jgi:hypothetical protein